MHSRSYTSQERHAARADSILELDYVFRGHQCHVRYTALNGCTFTIVLMADTPIGQMLQCHNDPVGSAVKMSRSQLVPYPAIAGVWQGFILD